MKSVLHEMHIIVIYLVMTNKTVKSFLTYRREKPRTLYEVLKLQGTQI